MATPRLTSIPVLLILYCLQDEVVSCGEVKKHDLLTTCPLADCGVTVPIVTLGGLTH